MAADRSPTGTPAGPTRPYTIAFSEAEFMAMNQFMSYGATRGNHPEHGSGPGPLTGYVDTMVNLNTRMAEVVRAATPPAPAAPTCAKCGGPLITNGHDWGCGAPRSACALGMGAAPAADAPASPFGGEWPTGVTPSTTHLRYVRTTSIPDEDAARMLTENPALQTTGWEAMLVRRVATMEARLREAERREVVLRKAFEDYGDHGLCRLTDGDGDACTCGLAEFRASLAGPPTGAEESR